MSGPETTPEQVAAEIAKKSGSSFYWAMRLLPRYKRSAMYAIYAFCREVDDIADGDGEIELKKSQLEEWRDRIEHLYAGHPDHPITCALQGPVTQFDLQKNDFAAVIDGMLTDAVPSLRIKNLDELTVYCDRVACAVGRLCVRVFEIDTKIGLELSKSLGHALQLTNILRDVAEDAERSHIYLPADMLGEHGVDTGDILSFDTREGVAAVCGELAKLTSDYYGEAGRLIRRCDKSQVRPALIMKNVYEKLFKRVTDRGWVDLNEPVSLSKFEKSALVVKSAFFP
ncbi:MAG: presqualene diphosphate synthase HpnD [Rhodospirillales bacterium]|nr:presqualene diphosphate synthase HpnD [Rhodospirillales bacterium]